MAWYCGRWTSWIIGRGIAMSDQPAPYYYHMPSGLPLEALHYGPMGLTQADVDLSSLIPDIPDEVRYANNVLSAMKRHDLVLNIGQGIISLPQGIANLAGGSEFLDGLYDALEANKWHNRGGAWVDETGQEHAGFYTPDSYDILNNMAGQVLPMFALNGYAGMASGLGHMIGRGPYEAPQDEALNFEYTGW